MERNSGKYLIIAVLGVVFVALLVATYLYYTKPLVVPGETLGCKIIEKNGEPGSKIDVVFLFDGVEEQAAEEYIDYFFSVAPFNDSRSKFNFYSVNFQPECGIQSGILFCYSRDALKAAALCPNEYIIVLSKQSASTRSSSYINLMIVNTANLKSVVPHEFAHAFANLADEYASNVIPRGSRNCVTACSNFKTETDGCFSGCAKDSYFRSIDNGLMRTLRTTDYGKFNKAIIGESLNEYS